MDVDLDFADRNKILTIIKHIPAILKDGKRHNTGVYCQEIPVNPLSSNSAIDYKQAEDRGYFKIDFLNVSIYKDIKNEDHLIELMNREPLWELLKQDDFVNLLFHLSGHSDILKKNCPTSLEQLAAVLAIIRPAKRYLIGKDWNTILNEVWIKPTTNEYYWKKSHAFGYAMVVVIHMNLICDQLTSSV
jgi:hypothetical protein